MQDLGKNNWGYDGFLIGNFTNNISRLGINTYHSVNFHIELFNHIRNNVSIPVITSSGTGKVQRFSGVFEKTDVEATLAAGIFHREEGAHRGSEGTSAGERNRDRIDTNTDSISAP